MNQRGRKHGDESNTDQRWYPFGSKLLLYPYASRTPLVIRLSNITRFYDDNRRCFINVAQRY